MSRRVDMEERDGLSCDGREGTGRYCRTCGDELLPCEKHICEFCVEQVEGLVEGNVIEVVPESRQRRERELGAAA